MSTPLLAAAGLAVLVLGYWAMHHDSEAAPGPAASQASAPAAPDSAGLRSSPHESSAASAKADLTTPSATPSAAAAAATSVAAATSPPPSAASAATDSTAMPRRVTVTTMPPRAQFYRFGKLAGTAPFVVDIPPGDRRAYEVWLPRHITRRLVIDGSKPHMIVGLGEEHVPD